MTRWSNICSSTAMPDAPWIDTIAYLENRALHKEKSEKEKADKEKSPEKEKEKKDKSEKSSGGTVAKDSGTTSANTANTTKTDTPPSGSSRNIANLQRLHEKTYVLDLYEGHLPWR